MVIHSIERTVSQDIRKKGGVATAIDNSLSFSPITLDTEAEAIAIEIKIKNEYISVLNYYNPPGKQIDTKIIENFITSKNKSIILGDFNSHHQLLHSPDENLSGKVMIVLAEKHDLTFLNTNTTYINPNTPHQRILDLALASPT